MENHPVDETTRREDPAARGADSAFQPASFLSWRLVVWGALIGGMALVASELTNVWWFVLVFGLLAPLVFALQARWSTGRNGRTEVPRQDKEGELLGALEQLGELTATTAAMRTTLTVEEAASMLEKLAKRGHLQATTQGAVMLYGLWETDRRRERALDPASPDAGEGAPATAHPGPEKPPVAALVEPLTEREREVFELLASGRTNREIAADLFVSVGTIKAHTSNIYAKLQARNRAEALARARELGLLG